MNFSKILGDMNMKKVLNIKTHDTSNSRKAEKEVYSKPQIIATTNKSSIGGAGCPTYSHKSQITCKC